MRTRRWVAATVVLAGAGWAALRLAWRSLATEVKAPEPSG